MFIFSKTTTTTAATLALAYAEANNTTVHAVAQEALEDARGSTTNTPKFTIP